MITDTGGVLTRTPAQLPVNNLEKRTTRITISDHLRLDFVTRIEITGERAKRLRYRIPFLTTDQEKIFYRDLFADTKRKLSIDSYEIENLDDINQPLIITLTGHCSRPVDKIKNQLYCKPMFLDQPVSFENAPMKERVLPLNLYYPDRLEHQISITWDSALPVDSVVIPDDTSFSGSFGSLSFASLADSNSVQIEYQKEYSAYEVGADQLGQFTEFQAVLKGIAASYFTLELGH